jgi:predicted Fe-S protein YdhL (DUF1289 family)
MKSDQREHRNIDFVVTKSDLHNQQDELSYWLSVSPKERIAAMKILRQRMFGGGDGTRQGLQRVCRIISRT